MNAKMNLTIRPALLCLGLISGLVSSCDRQAEETGETRVQEESSMAPDHVILNVTETPEHSLAVNWRSDTSVHQGIVEFAVATHGPEFLEQTSSIQAKTELFIHRYQEEPEVVVNYHSAVIEGLDPGEKYVYRVGSAEQWSEWFQVTLPDSRDKLSLIYFGDAQNDVKQMWSRVIRQAYATFPQVNFMLHAGDLINRYDRDSEWSEWFYAGSFIHATVPSLMTPGNHEYGDGVTLSPQWRPQFNLPVNGPQGLEETCYFINYERLKVVSLDAEQIDESPEFRNKQKQWLDSILTHDPRRWTAVTLHYPVFSTKPDRDNPVLKQEFKPLFDKHNVDIVLQGHDHAYGRGMVQNIPSGSNMHDQSNGTMYVVSVSGPKMYEVSADPWMERRAGNTQLFQLITIEDYTLSYQAFTATGQLYDAFDLVKEEGRPNQLINKIPDFPERLEPDQVAQDAQSLPVKVENN